MKKAISFLLALAMALSLFLTGCSNADKPKDDVPPASTSDSELPYVIDPEVAKTLPKVELIFHTHEPGTSDASKAMQEWCDMVNEASGGSIEITTYFGGILGTMYDSYYMVQDGSCDIAWAVQTSIPGTFPYTDIFALPRMGISTADMATDCLMDMYAETDYLAAELEPFHVLLLHGHNPCNLVVSEDIEFNDISAFKDMTIRINGAVPTKFVEMCGAIPVSIATGEIYSSMEKGVMVGMCGDFNNVRSYSLYELTKHALMMNLYCVPGYIVMNKDKWNSLAPEQQELFNYYDDLLREMIDEGWMSSIPFVEEQAKVYGYDFIEPNESLSASFDEIGAQLKEEWLADMNAAGHTDAEAALNWVYDWVEANKDKY